MNSLERVMNSIKGLPVDRVPVFAVLCAYGAKLTNCDLHALFSDADAYVAGQVAVQDAFGFDAVIGTFDFSALAEAFGGEVAWHADQCPTMKRPAAQDALSALRLALPDPRTTKRLPTILAALRHLVEIYGGEVPVFAVIPGPGILPTMMMGLEAWMDAVLFDQETALRVLERSGRFFVSWAKALLGTGITGLVVAEGMATENVLPRSIFAEFFLPHIRAMFELVDGPMIFHHSGGSINHIADLLPGLHGLLGVVVGSKDDLTEARRLIGPDLLLAGNLDNLGFPTATAGQIREGSLQCLRIAAQGGHFILSHSAADIPLATPPANLLAMIEASAGYARGDGPAR